MRVPLRVVNAAELIAGVGGLPQARDAGGDGNGVAASKLRSGVEYAQATVAEEHKLRSTFKARLGGGATPLVLVADDPDGAGFVRVLGPGRDGSLRRVRADSIYALAEQTLGRPVVQAARLLAGELDRLDTERTAGLRVRGLGTEHLYDTRLPGSARWAELERLVDGVSAGGWHELLSDLGYVFQTLEPEGYLALADGRPTIVVFPRDQAWMFARLDGQGRLPEGALLAECRARSAPFGILASGTRLRLLQAGEQEAGAATRYLELDAAAIEPDRRALLGLLSPAYLAEGGFAELQREAPTSPIGSAGARESS